MAHAPHSFDNVTNQSRDGLIGDIIRIPFCPYTILSIPFCPYHFVCYHFVLEPFCPILPHLLSWRVVLDTYKTLSTVHSFIHCRHLYSASSSGATQKRSQPQRSRIMLF